MFTTEELRKPRKNVANKRLLFIEIRNQQKGSKHVRCTSRAAWPRVSQHRTRVGKQAASDILRETTQQFRAFTDQNVCVYTHRPMYTHIKICKGSSKSYGKCILWKHCMDFKYFWHQNKLIFNSIFQVYLRFPPIFHTYTHISSQENATVIQCPVSHTYTVHTCTQMLGGMSVSDSGSLNVEQTSRPLLTMKLRSHPPLASNHMHQDQEG